VAAGRTRAGPTDDETIEQYEVDFEPIGRRGQCPGDGSLLDCARHLGVALVSVCGGNGTCGGCRVQMLAGQVSEPTSAERDALSEAELAAGYRLACQVRPLSDCRLRVPAESLSTPQRTQIDGLEVSVPPDPAVSRYRLELEPSSLEAPEADAESLLQGLERQHGVACGSVDIEVLRELSPRLRSCDWRISASVRAGEVVAVGLWSSQHLGLAVDLGTTKIAAYLVDLSTGQTLASRGIMNPQIAYGEDVISRIARTRESPAEAKQLQEIVIESLNQAAAGLCAEVGAAPAEIVDAVAVGNTAMHHLLLRLPVEQLALSPYVAAVRGALDIKARDIGLRIAPGAYVHLPPVIAGFVGADHVAMLLAVGASRREGLVVALDIGTNTEVCLVSDGRMTTASCASGPAFEGAHIKHGMRAADGAIEHLRLVDKRVEYQTIGGAPPVGICGSGILDAVAQLYRAGVLSANGRMNTGHPRVHAREAEREFILVSEEERGERGALAIAQKDVREIQMAKGAMRTGIHLLLEDSGRSEDEISEVIIAGAFGSYINVESATTIGMLPPLPLDRFRQVGNAAGTGARLILISKEKRAEAEALAGGVGYLELAAAAGFTRAFAQANYLGRYWLVDGTRKEVG
jgi:uncharacterized 2Fe-2S/4Fe-4S cluster protein (DUF4445 family)